MLTLLVIAEMTGFTWSLIETILLLSAVQKISGNNFAVKVALVQWENPQRALKRSTGEVVCCDNYAQNPPNCSINDCDTRFEVCVRLYSSGQSEESCPYGSYLSNYDSTYQNSDNISFTIGVGLAGNVPNPMTFKVQEDILNVGLRITVRVFDDDTETTDDLIDVMQFEIRSPSLGENYTYLSATGQNNLGTLVIAYNISCLTGYTGEDCSQSIDNSNTTGQNCSNPVTNDNPTVSTRNGQTSDDSKEYNISLLFLVILNIIICISLVVFSVALMMQVYRKNKKDDRHNICIKSRASSPLPPLPPINILPPPSPSLSAKSGSYKDSLPIGTSSTLLLHSNEGGSPRSPALFADDGGSDTNLNPAYGSLKKNNENDDYI